MFEAPPTHPLDEQVRMMFDLGKDFKTTQIHLRDRMIRVCTRVHGLPFIIDIDLIHKQACFLDNVALKVPTETTQQGAYQIKVKSVLDNYLAMDRIKTHCIECNFFQWNGASTGPLCLMNKSRGCHCTDFMDEAWGCPLPDPKFTALTVKANDSNKS